VELNAEHPEEKGAEHHHLSYDEVENAGRFIHQDYAEGYQGIDTSYH
jgi:hypothetical protein